MNEKTHLSIDSFVAMSKALSDTNRVRAFCTLRKGELCVCQIIELIGLAPSTISRHMSILKQAGLVDSRKDGRWVYYRPAEKRSGGLMGEIIKLSISALQEDEQVRVDDKQMSRITSEGLEVLCKRQRCANGN